jgi:energy-coupling factor transporter ATP-binding protein EcfA2
MRFKSLRAVGFRSFRDEFELDTVAKVTAFVGRNNTGKSNLLEILKFLNRPQSGQNRFVDLAFRGKDEFLIESKIELNPEDRRRFIASLYGKETQISEGAYLNHFLEEITHNVRFNETGLIGGTVLVTNVEGKPLLIWDAHVKQGQSGRPRNLTISSMDLAAACRSQSVVTAMRERMDNRGDIGQTWAFFEPPTLSEPVPQALLEFYNRIHWVDTLRKSDAQQTAQERNALSSGGGDLAQVWNHLASESPKLLAKICEDINRVIRGIPDSGAPLRGGSATIRFTESWGGTFTLPNSATGTQQTAIIVTKLETGPAGGVFLLEEPESHLHPGAQRRLKDLLESSSQAEQVFLTTHSTIFGLGGGRTGSFLVSRKEGASSVTRSISQDDALALLLELGHSHTDLLGHDVLLCLEGDSELIAVPRIARVLDLDLESLGVGLFNLHGRGGVRRIPELLGYLRQIGVRPYLVLDSEHDVGEMMLELEKQSLLQKGWATVWPADFEDLFGPEMISEACASLGLTGITPQVLAGIEQAGAGSSVGSPVRGRPGENSP